MIPLPSKGNKGGRILGHFLPTNQEMKRTPMMYLHNHPPHLTLTLRDGTPPGWSPTAPKPSIPGLSRGRQSVWVLHHPRGARWIWSHVPSLGSSGKCLMGARPRDESDSLVEKSEDWRLVSYCGCTEALITSPQQECCTFSAVRTIRLQESCTQASPGAHRSEFV